MSRRRPVRPPIALRLVPDAGPEPGTIAILEECLADARAGRLRSVGVVVVWRDGAVGTRYHRSEGTYFKMVAGAADLAARLREEI